MELSLCMIAKNEEEHLGSCLESVKDAVDEIIILDTGSTDGTKALALSYTPNVYDYLWQDDFAAARNASMAYATKPFILWLDADDVIDEPQKLLMLKERLNDEIDAVMMPYHYAFLESGAPSLVFDRERIVRRAAGFSFSGAVHEAMAVSGNVIRADIVVRHTGKHGERSNTRNLSIYESMLARGGKLSARDQYYYARELRNAGEMQRAERAFHAFLLMEGWRENRIDAFVQRGECLVALGRRDEAKRSYLMALIEDAPRAEACCALGACLMEEGDLSAAAHWYRFALACQRPEGSGFVSLPAYGYVPLMQLCVIYSKMGDEVLASQMNEQALLLCPEDKAALSNRAYFQKRLAGAESHE